MRTSARNHFAGQVGAVKPGAVNDEITLRTQDGLDIVAVITHGSAASGQRRDRQEVEPVPHRRHDVAGRRAVERGGQRVQRERGDVVAERFGLAEPRVERRGGGSLRG